MKMETKSKNTFVPYAIWVGIILLCVLLLYFIFKTEGLKTYKTSLEDELNWLKKEIKRKERNIAFLISEISRLKLLENSIFGYGLRLYKTIKLILLAILVTTCIISYTIFNFNFIASIMIIIPVVTLSYYGITVAVKNRVGDFNRTLKLVQEYFIDFVFKLKGFDINLIEVIEAKLQVELKELEELKTKYSIYELNVATLTKN
jgi:hypothetical protein